MKTNYHKHVSSKRGRITTMAYCLCAAAFWYFLVFQDEAAMYRASPKTETSELWGQWYARKGNGRNRQETFDRKSYENTPYIRTMLKIIFWQNVKSRVIEWLIGTNSYRTLDAPLSGILLSGISIRISPFGYRGSLVAGMNAVRFSRRGEQVNNCPGESVVL